MCIYVCLYYCSMRYVYSRDKGVSPRKLAIGRVAAATHSCRMRVNANDDAIYVRSKCIPRIVSLSFKEAQALHASQMSSAFFDSFLQIYVYLLVAADVLILEKHLLQWIA